MSSTVVVTVAETGSEIVEVIMDGPQGPPGPSGGDGTLVGLTDVTGTPAVGKAPVYDGASFALTDVATQDELDAEASARTAAITVALATAEGYADAIEKLAVAQTAHGFVVGNVVLFNGTSYAKAKADSAANAEVIGIVSAVADANHFTLQIGGEITGLSGLAAGSVYFLDPSTAGAITATEPSTVGQVSKPVLIALSATAAVVTNMRGLVVTAAGVPTARTITAGAGLSGGGDLSADRTLSASVDGSTIDTNGSSQLEVKTGGVGTTQLANAGPGATGPIGDGTHVAQVTIDAKGRVTALSSVAITTSGADHLGLTPTAVKTSGYTASPGDLVPCDISSGGFTVTLPTTPSDGAVICVEVVKRVTTGNPNYVTVACGGSDVLFAASGATSGLIGRGSIIFQYNAAAAIWYAPGAGDLLPTGWEFGYDQITSPVSVTSTTEASGTTVMTCAAHIFDGNPVIVRFVSPSIVTVANNFLLVNLFESSTQICRLAEAQASSGQTKSAIGGEFRFTPSAGSHTYTLTAYNGASGTGTVAAGSGGTGGFAPTGVWFTKA